VMSDRTESSDRFNRTGVDEQHAPERERLPGRPSDLDRGHWWGAVKRTVAEYRVDNLSDWAAALTYYGVLSIFPALLVLVSALGLAGRSATQSLLNNLGQLASGSVRQDQGARQPLRHRRGGGRSRGAARRYDQHRRAVRGTGGGD